MSDEQPPSGSDLLLLGGYTENGRSRKASVIVMMLPAKVIAYAKTVPALRRIKDRLNFQRALRESRKIGPKYAEFIQTVSAHCGGSLDGMRVLEAGVRPVPDLIAEIDRTFRVKEAIGINLLVNHTTQYTPTMRAERGDLRKIGYPDNYFDLIVSSSVFEHVHNFDVALAEMYRVLRPGRHLFTQFGPIWSGSYGHHLWHIQNYHSLILPPHCHLLMTQAEVRDWLIQKGQPQADEIASYVFTSDEQNQLMFSDYDRIVADSSFERLFFKGYDFPALQTKYTQLMSAEHFSILNQKFPADRDAFLYDGIAMLLRKPADGGG